MNLSLGARSLLLVLRLLQWLPMAWQAGVGRALGRLLHALAGSRRRIALRNVELCFPTMPPRERAGLVRDHFEWLGRSLLERGLLLYAPFRRLKRLIHVEGEVHFAENCPKPVMWLVPHFMGLDVAAAAVQLFQRRHGATIYQTQSDPVFDAAMRQGRLRFGQAEVFPRSDTAKPLLRAIKQKGLCFFNLPDMDFGAKDAAFIPFFGVPAATLLAPSRMARLVDMVVQPIVAEMLPGGQGYRVRFLPPWTDFPTDDALADTRRINAFIEDEIRRNPAQYLWVHKRFKTRPPGEAPVY